MHPFANAAHFQVLELTTPQEVKNLQRQSIEMDVKAFLANGGIIQKIPIGKSALNYRHLMDVNKDGRVHIRIVKSRAKELH